MSATRQPSPVGGSIVEGTAGSRRSARAPTLRFLGAAGTVTGSRFLLDNQEDRLLVDAGLYQGRRELRRRNWDSFPVPPDLLDSVVLTHAHLDHTGYLPRLVREGFAGEVVCTPETAALAAIVLRDSAHLQEEDARYANEAGWSVHHPALPLYNNADVEQALTQIHAVPFGRRRPLGTSTDLTLHPAGHILGSSIAVVDAGDLRVVFSGDLGRPRHPLLPPPARLPAASALVIESTYGDRHHGPHDPERLASAIRRTVARGGTVLMPAFAVDRTEVVLLELLQLREDERIPHLPIYVDSPMALAALDVYRAALRRTPGAFRPEGAALLDLDRLDIRQVRDADSSQQLNRPRSPCIIISASGMATGGRVVHHLAHQLPDSRNCVVLTGYQAEGTRGRQLLDGARALKMYGHYVPVRAEIVNVTDFSVHADADELLAWVASAEQLPGAVYVVHGENGASDTLARRITEELDLVAVVPRLGEQVRIG